MQTAHKGLFLRFDFIRKRLAIRPDRAILKMLLLPDWNRLLQRINEPAASVKSRSSMGRGHGNGYAGFADLKLPQAMYHPNIPHFKTFKCSLR